MRTLFLFTLCLFATSLGSAQTYEVGVSVGATNFVGDVGNTTYIRPTDVGFGVVAKWNRSTRHAFRFSALYLPLSADDSESDDLRKQQRNFDFENSVKELSLGIEYTFLEWDLHEGGKQMTPYMYTGITIINYGALAFANDDTFKAYDNSWTAAIPIVLGIKANLGLKMTVAFEAGARYSFTDNLDGSNPKDLNLPVNNVNLNFGNLNTNDWYFYSALTLAYSFGRKPCYCGF